MSEKSPNPLSRRDALKTGGKLAAASALAGVAIPHVHAASDNAMKLAVIGCGGRGTGAVKNALSVSKLMPEKVGPVKLTAMADVFENRLTQSRDTLERQEDIKDMIDVPEERQFLGFEAYKNAIDSVGKGGVVIFTTPLAFRGTFFKYAIDKGVNVFMEKPVIADGPSARRMLKLAKEADAKGLKVGVGLMCRHCDARNELKKRIQDGEIGDVHTMRGYRMQGPIGSCFSGPNETEESELAYQIRRFHSFLWLSGGAFSDFFIHNIDECCMMKDEWPVDAKASGGRHYREDGAIDQNFDNYSVEYTFADGTKLFFYGRNMIGCHQEFASYAQGTKGSAVISTSSHTPARCRTYSDQNIEMNWRKPAANQTWAYPQEPRERNPYDVEWETLLSAIRNNEPYNEVPRGVAASLVTSMGRMAAHTGQIITYDDMLNCEHEFGPGVDNITSMDDASPLVADADGTYPIPEPGIKKDREY
jgi:predicted dehydrogenase